MKIGQRAELSEVNDFQRIGWMVDNSTIQMINFNH